MERLNSNHERLLDSHQFQVDILAFQGIPFIGIIYRRRRSRLDMLLPSTTHSNYEEMGYKDFTTEEFSP